MQMISIAFETLKRYDTKSWVFSLITDFYSGCDWTVETWSCCSSSKPCWLFEGDCDNDDECLGVLKCGKDNCLSPFSLTADCCYNPLAGKQRSYSQ